MLLFKARQSKWGEICSGCFDTDLDNVHEDELDGPDGDIYDREKGLFLLIILYLQYAFLAIMALGCLNVYCILWCDKYRNWRDRNQG